MKIFFNLFKCCPTPKINENNLDQDHPLTTASPHKLTEIPDDVMLVIFQYLFLGDLRNVSFVSKKWKDLSKKGRLIEGIRAQRQFHQIIFEKSRKFFLIDEGKKSDYHQSYEIRIDHNYCLNIIKKSKQVDAKEINLNQEKSDKKIDCLIKENWVEPKLIGTLKENALYSYSFNHLELNIVNDKLSPEKKRLVERVVSHIEMQIIERKHRQRKIF